MKDDEREYRDARFVEIVAEPALKNRLKHHVDQMTGPGEPVVTEADRQAGRQYLCACMNRMSITELSEKADDELVALWARGSLGAARYRVRGRPIGRHGRSARAKADEGHD
jgi:hypothetical protein